MKRALALRLRGLPSVLPRSDRFSLVSRKTPLLIGERNHSTTQESRLWDSVGIPPSMVASRPGHEVKLQPRDVKNKLLSHRRDSTNTPSQTSPTKHASKEGAFSHQSKVSGNNYTTQEKGRMVRSKAAANYGSKRKLESSQHSYDRRQKKAKFPPSGPATPYDRSSLMQTISLPSRSRYPKLPPDFISAPKQFLHNNFRQLGLRTSVDSIGFTHCRCITSLELLSGTKLEAIGEGKTKKEAEHASSLHMIAKIHEAGLIAATFENNLVDRLNERTRNDEKDAKLDIYNYAARYCCVPIVSVKETSRLRLKGSVFEVTVEMPEQNIKVSGRGHGLANAEIAASIKFKQEAEKYHAGQGTSSLVVKDASCLGMGNGWKFFEFYRMVKPGPRIEAETQKIKQGRSLRFQATVTVDGEIMGGPVAEEGKKKAEDLAYLIAAVRMVRKDPELLTQFLEAPRSASGDILKPMRPVTLSVDDDCVILMRETLLTARRAGLADEHEDLESDENATEVRKARPRPRLDLMGAERRSVQLLQDYREYLRNPELLELRTKKEALPMNQYRAKVLDMVNKNHYSIIIGATGSGKTTQVPQILLEDAIQKKEGAACNIICTQPRRIAATSVAKRVSEERAEKLQDSVGYHVRFDAKLPRPGGSVVYCTTGILLQQLQHSPDDTLDFASHLIIDEVHERDMQIDFLLIILKTVMAQRLELKKSVPKIVLMSATMDSELFASYFAESHPTLGTGNCPTLSVPGRTFPVQEQHLENILVMLEKKWGQAQLRAMYSDPMTRDYVESEKVFAKANPLRDGDMNGQPIPQADQEDESIIDWKKERKISSSGEVIVSSKQEDSLVPIGLVATMIAHIASTTEDGAILVFLPGLEEIVKVDKLLQENKLLGVDFRNQDQFKTYMLHSSIANGQSEVFNPVPKGCRKIILGTNIAETSITIPDVQYVVDTGKLREKQYDQLTRISQLACTWVSKSNSKQRAGRAGRVQNGHYYALFSKPRYESLRAIGLPELLRADLQETCLDVKAQAFKTPIREFLAGAIEAPHPAVVNEAVLNLQALDALTEEEKITPLGRLLASLPIHPSLGKMVILGVIFRCLDPMLILGAASSERGLFLRPLGAKRAADDAKMSFVQGSGSDHIALLNGFRALRSRRDQGGHQVMRDFGLRNFLHLGSFQSIDGTAKQIEDVLVASGLIPYTPPHERNDSQFGSSNLNINSKKMHVVKALALAGMHPNLAASVGGRLLRTRGERGLVVHPGSVNAPPQGRNDVQSPISYGSLFSYTSMAHSNDGNQIFIRETTESTPLMACLFGGRLSYSNSNHRIINMDTWLPFYVRSDDFRATKTIMEFRKALERLLTGAFKDLSSRQLLAENPIRETFAIGLEEVLSRDVRASDRTRGRGWAQTQSRGQSRGQSENLKILSEALEWRPRGPDSRFETKRPAGNPLAPTPRHLLNLTDGH